MADLTDNRPPIESSDTTVQLIKVADFPAVGAPLPSRVQEVIDPPDGADRLYATDTYGVVSVIENGKLLPDPLLDLRGRDDFLQGGGEAGLRSIAFHPDFQDPSLPGYGKVYASYSAPTGNPQGVTVFEQASSLSNVVFHTVISEFTLVDPSNPVEIDPDSKRELFRGEQPFANHNTSSITFNTAAQPGDSDYGLLYIAVSDGGGGFDPGNQSQDLSLLSGSIVRIDPVEQADGSAYGIPTDNPFVDVDGALPEIFAYGVRNPQTISFDSNGTAYFNDIGQNAFEEINILLPGENYGWDVREGNIIINRLTTVRFTETEADIADFQYPLSGFDHQEIADTDPFGSDTAAIGGGFVYEGDDIPELQNHVVFTEFSGGQVFIASIDTLDAALADGQLTPDEFVQPTRLEFVIDGKPVTIQEELGNPDTGRTDSRLGVDENGELYVFSKRTGDIWRFANIDETPSGGGGDGGGGEPLPTSQFSLLYSEAANRENATLLGGAEIPKGAPLYAFVGGDQTIIESVSFSVDAVPTVTDVETPFDANGTALDLTAIAFPTSNLGTGTHSVTAVITYSDDGELVTQTLGDTFSITTPVSVEGTTGNDTLVGDSGQNLVRGLPGDDSIDGRVGSDTLLGNFGNDTIAGGGGADSIIGGANDDVLLGGAGDDSMRGGLGDDTLRGGLGNDTVSGNTGADIVVLAAGEGTDTVNSFSVEDGDRFELAGSLQFDDLDFVDADEDGNGEIIIVATGETLAEVSGVGISILDDPNLFAAVSIDGSGDNDTLTGGSGNDSGRGFVGDDIMNGLGGADTLIGDKGEDTLWGNGGADLLVGAADNDSLIGGAGDDSIRGGNGDDTLRGGSGNDTVSGNSGADVYLLSAGEGTDTLPTFSTAEGDRFDLVDGLTFADLLFRDVDSDGNGEIVVNAAFNGTEAVLAEVLNVSATDLNDVTLFV